MRRIERRDVPHGSPVHVRHEGAITPPVEMPQTLHPMRRNLDVPRVWDDRIECWVVDDGPKVWNSDVRQWVVDKSQDDQPIVCVPGAPVQDVFQNAVDACLRAGGQPTDVVMTAVEFVRRGGDLRSIPRRALK